MLNVRSAHSDVTARARIRDAAVERFARHGFAVPLREIAATAGVSAALIVHHFGSKEGLREACDEHVLRTIREAKTEAMTSADPPSLLAALAAPGEYAVPVAYILRSVRSGGAMAATFVQHLVDDARGYLDTGVASGMLRPSRDPDARARYLAYQSLGALLIHATVEPSADPSALVESYQRLAVLPSLEIYTEGLLRDRALLDGYLETRENDDDR